MNHKGRWEKAQPWKTDFWFVSPWNYEDPVDVNDTVIDHAVMITYGSNIVWRSRRIKD